MKTLKIAVLLLMGSMTVQAQDDPVIMTIAGQPVTRSEFEYSFNKNNAEGVIDKKSVEEYADLFINYKLKVQAALDARLDTLKSFQDEFTGYRDQQIRPSLITDADVDAEARNIYQETKDQIGPRGLILPAHILVLVGQRATQAQQTAAKQKIDSIYAELKKGADFAGMAQKLSDDKGSAAKGGELPWIGPGQTLKEFEETAYSLQTGEMSRPVLSPAGWHIIKMNGRKQIEPYDSLKEDIIRFMNARGIREGIIDQKLDKMVEQAGPGASRKSVMDAKAAEMAAQDSDLKNLIQEYHDGLLLYEISNRTVWEKAAKDEAGLAAYFKAHRKQYNWSEPRFKGMAYHVKEKADVKAVKNCVKGLAFDKWADRLRTTFNNDSVLRIRVEKGIFKAGDNSVVDKMVFKKNVTVKPTKGYPIDATYGKLLKKGPETYEDVKGQVTADYQDELEKEWVASLRKKYPVVVNKDVLATVNKH